MKIWIAYLFKVWRREFKLVFKDPGVMLFFFALPTLYPIVYTLIYNPEIVEKITVAVVDNSRTAMSRELVRSVDAMQSADVIGYASDMGEARRWMAEKKCYGVMEIPADYTQRIGRGEQAVANFYCDTSLLLRYRALLFGLTTLQIDVNGDLRQETLASLGMAGEAMEGSKSVEINPVIYGDTSQGFASFVMPGILVLILQQSLVLGVTMLAGGRAERRRRFGGVDPEDYPDAPASTKVLGRMFCYFVLYAPMLLYTLHFIPAMFNLPDAGHLWEYWLFIMPMIVASAFFGETIGVFVTERESSMLVVVFTSVLFLFLSGLTWPRYALSGFWTVISDLIPATWGVEGFIRMSSDGAALYQQGHCYLMLWVLAAGYFLTSWILTRYYMHTARIARSVKRPLTPSDDLIEY